MPDGSPDPHGSLASQAGPAPAGARPGPGRMRSADRAEDAFEHVLARSRLLVLVPVPVVVFVVAALGAFVYGTVVFVDGVRTVVDHPIPWGTRSGSSWWSSTCS